MAINPGLAPSIDKAHSVLWGELNAGDRLMFPNGHEDGSVIGREVIDQMFAAAVKGEDLTSEPSYPISVVKTALAKLARDTRGSTIREVKGNEPLTKYLSDLVQATGAWLADPERQFPVEEDINA